MENQPSAAGRDGVPIDPLAQLSLLDRSRRAVEYEAFLNFGPWWYAPLFATMIGASTLSTAELTSSTEQISSNPAVFESSLNLGYLALVLLSAVVLIVHWYRNRIVTPTWLSTTAFFLALRLGLGRLRDRHRVGRA